jgi:hypothetical protein
MEAAHDAHGEIDAEQIPNGDYVDRLMRRESFQALWPLFARATRPAKELTESYSALVHLRPYLKAAVGPCRVVHVGDGAHARTAALFALKTRAENVSVDPTLNIAVVEEWRTRFAVERFTWMKSRIEDAAERLAALPRVTTLVTFVHAHVSVDTVLRHLDWDAAYSLACCVPGKQFTTEHALATSGADPSVLSGSRQYQVFVNRSGRIASCKES